MIVLDTQGIKISMTFYRARRDYDDLTFRPHDSYAVKCQKSSISQDVLQTPDDKIISRMITDAAGFYPEPLLITDPTHTL